MWLALLGLAQAGCEKDTDCKGDRICVQSQCVDPPTTAPALIDPGPSKLARARLGDSRGRMITGWSLGGCGSLFGVTAVGLALAEAPTAAPVSTGIVGVGFLAAAAPVSAASGGRARDGLRALDQPVPGNGLRIAGWSSYGAGMGIAVISIAVGGATEEPAFGAVGFVGLAGALTGITLLQLDGNMARAQLNVALARRATHDEALQVALGPVVVDQGGGLGLTVVR